MYKKIKKLEGLKEEYEHFVYEWNKTHSISKAPSFTSWKKFYKSN